MKVIYIAGPFRAANTWLIESNIRRAETLALKVWALGAAAVCPHANTRFYQGILPDKTWLDGDLEILRRCDAIMLAPRWEKSSGTLAEIELARDIGMPVFETLEKLKEWLKEP